MNSIKPADLYTHVSKMVEKKIVDHAKDPEHKFHELAKKLVGNIKRKTVK